MHRHTQMYHCHIHDMWMQMDLFGGPETCPTCGEPVVGVTPAKKKSILTTYTSMDGRVLWARGN